MKRNEYLKHKIEDYKSFGLEIDEIVITMKECIVKLDNQIVERLSYNGRLISIDQSDEYQNFEEYNRKVLCQRCTKWNVLKDNYKEEFDKCVEMYVGDENYREKIVMNCLYEYEEVSKVRKSDMVDKGSGCEDFGEGFFGKKGAEGLDWNLKSWDCENEPKASKIIKA